MGESRAAPAGEGAPSAPWQVPLAATVMVIAALAAYGNSLHGPFVFDDETSIPENPTIRSLWPIWRPLLPPGAGATVQGRPVVNLSLALCYAVGKLDVVVYHVTNLLIHILAALALMGIVRRTLSLPRYRARFGAVSLPLAMAVALIWMLHPLQTAAVTYVVQRAESLMGLFFLLTLYCAIRGAESPRPRKWYLAVVVACALGMGSKEVMASAPLIVLLYDWLLLAGSLRQTLRRRWKLYVGLAATWLILGGLLLGTRTRGGTAGVGSEVGVFDYAKSEFGVILHYLSLALYPRGQCLDLGWPVAKTVGEILPGALVVGALLGATACALWRRSAWAVVGAWFFLILAPTSSVWPLNDLAFEHRMYLSLASVVVLAVLGGYAIGQVLLRRWVGSAPARKVLGWAAGGSALVGVAGTLGALTILRNMDYGSVVAIYEDTVAKAPRNPRVQYNYGLALAKAGRPGEAEARYRKALAMKDDYVDACVNLASILSRRNELDEAIALCRKAIAIRPRTVAARTDLASFLARRNRFDEALAEYAEAVKIAPNHPDVHYNYGLTLAQGGRYQEAVAEFRLAIRARPRHAEAYNNLGAALVRLDKLDEAAEALDQSLRLDPASAQAHSNYAAVLLRQGRYEDAIDQYNLALSIDPFLASARAGLASAREKLSPRPPPPTGRGSAGQ